MKSAHFLEELEALLIRLFKTTKVDPQISNHLLSIIDSLSQQAQSSSLQFHLLKQYLISSKNELANVDKTSRSLNCDCTGSVEGVESTLQPASPQHSDSSMIAKPSPSQSDFDSFHALIESKNAGLAELQQTIARQDDEIQKQQSLNALQQGEVTGLKSSVRHAHAALALLQDELATKLSIIREFQRDYVPRERLDDALSELHKAEVDRDECFVLLEELEQQNLVDSTLLQQKDQVVHDCDLVESRLLSLSVQLDSQRLIASKLQAAFDELLTENEQVCGTGDGQ